MTLRKGGGSWRKREEGGKKVLRAYALAAAGMLCGVLVFAACGEEYTRISTEVDNFMLQTVALEAGSSHTFDLEEIFSESGLAIEKYVIEGGEDKNYTVRGNTITARGTGICPVNVSRMSRPRIRDTSVRWGPCILTTKRILRPFPPRTNCRG